MKPLGLFISPYPQTGIEYKASYPTNLYQRLRLGVARTLIKLGYNLLLNNSFIKFETDIGRG